jgi:hypothetical protein
MSNSWASALGAGLSAFGGIKMDMDQQAKRDAERAELAKYEQAAAERRERYRAARQLPQISTIERTGPDGQAMKVSIKSSYDPELDQVVTEEMGSVPLLAAKERNAQVETFYDEATGMPYKAERAEDGSWKRVGGMQAPRNKGGVGKVEKDPKATSLTSSEIEALFSQTDENGESRTDTKAYKQFLAFQTRNAKNDPRFRDAKFAVQQWANQVGFDPDEKVAGTFTLEDTGNGPVETLSASGDVGSTPTRPSAAKDGAKKATPGASRDNPIPAQSLKAEPAPGTWVKLPDGRIIQTKG